MGEGRNAVFLAKKGFEVDGVDLSEVALEKNAATRSRKSRDRHDDRGGSQYLHDQTGILRRDSEYRLSSAYVDSPDQARTRHGGMVVYENYTVKQLENTGGKAFSETSSSTKGSFRSYSKTSKSSFIVRATTARTPAQASSPKNPDKSPE